MSTRKLDDDDLPSVDERLVSTRAGEHLNQWLIANPDESEEWIQSDYWVQIGRRGGRDA